MIKAIMAVDEKGGISKGKSMPWPKNTKDLNWFKKNTLNQVVVMGSGTWSDPSMPTPLILRENVLITSKNKSYYPGANRYLNGDDIVLEIQNLETIYTNKDIFIIGGSKIINNTISIVQEFYLTRIYGNFNCEKFINLGSIEKNMILKEKIDCDKTCHFEIWKK